MANGRATKRMDSFHVHRSQLRPRQAPTDVAPWAEPCQRWRGVPFIKQIRDHATHPHTAMARCFEPGSTSKGKVFGPVATTLQTEHRRLSVGLRLRAHGNSHWLACGGQSRAAAPGSHYEKSFRKWLGVFRNCGTAISKEKPREPPPVKFISGRWQTSRMSIQAVLKGLEVVDDIGAVVTSRYPSPRVCNTEVRQRLVPSLCQLASVSNRFATKQLLIPSHPFDK